MMWKYIQILNINYNGHPVYLFSDTVHLVKKNLWNNLIANKRLLFATFEVSGFEQDVIMPGGNSSWSLLHDMHNTDSLCSSNLRKAHRLYAQVRKQLLIWNKNNDKCDHSWHSVYF